MIHRSKYPKDFQKQKPGISGKVFCSSLMPAVPILLCFLLLFSMAARAEVAPVAIRIPEAKAWIGQRLPFYVELRARGSFAGAASFSLPEIPRTVILKVGNPVVSSQEIDGDSWFVQTHEFALFSQQSGTLQIPGFEVRFASRDGFTGPVKEQQAQVPAARIEIQRPPGSESIGFLVTTESLDLTENWEPQPQPQPGPVKVGAIFKRTIIQRAAQITGMALAAAPTDAPDGVRVYPGQPEVTDKTERGDFLGERRETITYQLQKPGSFELPELSYRVVESEDRTAAVKNTARRDLRGRRERRDHRHAPRLAVVAAGSVAGYWPGPMAASAPCYVADAILEKTKSA